MKKNLIKLIDNLIRFILGNFLPNKKTQEKPVKIRKVLIIRPGGLGDALLLLHSIYNLNKSNEDIQIDILAEKRNKQAFDFIKINKIYLYDNFKDFFKIINMYKFYDLVIDTEQWHFLTSLFARYLGKITAGYNTNIKRKNFDIIVNYYHKKYEQDMFYELFHNVTLKLGLNLSNENFTINFSKNNELSYDIVIFTGSTAWQRKWPLQNYIELIKKLHNDKFKICLIGGKGEINFNKKIENNINCQIENLTSKLNLKEIALLFNSSKILFSTDSGILHLGVLSNIRTVSIFGPGIEEKWAPKGKNHIVINKKLPCSPCTKFGYMKKCKKNAECMRSITVNDVYKSIMKLISN